MNTMTNAPARYAAQLADEIAAVQWQIDIDDPANRDEWWRDVLDHLNRLLYVHYSKLAANPTIRPNVRPSEILPESARFTPPWMKKAPGESGVAGLRDIVHEQVCHDDRLKAIEARLSTIEDWADFPEDFSELPEGVTAKCIHDLIAEGMTGVTADIQREVNELYGIFGVAHQQILKLTARIDALETKSAL